MSYSIFMDKNTYPDDTGVMVGLRDKKALWQAMLDFINGTCRLKGDWRYYGKNYGWARRFSKGGKSMISLYPGSGEIYAQIIVKDDLITKARELNIGEQVLKIFAEANP